jgi:hypothetical protein
VHVVHRLTQNDLRGKEPELAEEDPLASALFGETTTFASELVFGLLPVAAAFAFAAPLEPPTCLKSWVLLVEVRGAFL